MARRMTKSTQRTDETPLHPLNENEQSVGSLEHGTVAPAGGGGMNPDIRSRIEVLAYDLYLRRGSNHGDDVSDWLEAERLTRGATK
jgi:DUF2934 family protein